MTAIFQFSNILQRIAVPRIIDQFRHKRCQKKRKDVDYKLLQEIFVAHQFTGDAIGAFNETLRQLNVSVLW